MEIKRMTGDFSVCKAADDLQVNTEAEYWLVSESDGEKMLVCLTADVPEAVIAWEAGWSAFRTGEKLALSQTGILSEISLLLTRESIPNLVVSACDTDYILVKTEFEMKAMSKLARAGYKVSTGDAYGDYFMNRSAADIMAEYSEQRDEWKTVG